jgi:hypothetical protein
MHCIEKKQRTDAMIQIGLFMAKVLEREELTLKFCKRQPCTNVGECLIPMLRAIAGNNGTEL